MTGGAGHPPLEGERKQLVDCGHSRLIVAAVAFAAAFLGIAVRLVDLAVLHRAEPALAVGAPGAPPVVRADIVGRDGALLATSLPSASLYADPALLPDPAEAARRLAELLPEVDAQALAAELETDRRFVWIKRHLTPEEQYAVNRLGIPGLDFRHEFRRIYPMGRLAAHAVGFTDIDGNGLAGLERAFDRRLRQDPAPFVTALHAGAQDVLRRALAHAVERFHAVGAAGMVMDVDNGEVVALVSLPDFDPNRSEGIDEDARFNRVTLGTYEMGSTFKIFTTATALDAGTVTLADGYDASEPIHVARFLIRDYHAKRRYLTVPEIFIYSSNIGSAKMAREIGVPTQRLYLDRFGLLAASPIEIRETAQPLVPEPWREINAMTIAYGHGLSVSPAQLVAGVAAAVNGGIWRAPTLRLRARPSAGRRVISPATSERMRRLLRLAVIGGTGSKAEVPGYRVGGKTGTAEKVAGRRYSRKALISSFVGVFPIDAPRFVVFAMLDEPKGRRDTFGYATGGWVAAPAVGEVIARLAPMFGIAPAEPEEERTVEQMLAELAPRGRHQLASY